MQPRPPTSDVPNFRARRLALGFALLVLGGVSALAVSAGAPAQEATSELEGKMQELESNVDQQGDLQSTIDAQNAEINSVIAAESELRRKADTVQAELDERQAELDAATEELNAEKAHLAEIRARLDRALVALEELLVQMYKSNDSDTLSVVLNSSTWEEVLSETEYLDRIQAYDEAVVERVSGLRDEIEEGVAKLQGGPGADQGHPRRGRSAPCRARAGPGRDRGAALHSSSPCAPSARPPSRRCRPASPLSRRTSAPRSPAPASAPR